MMEYLENGNIVNSVNYPSVSAPRVSGCERICVLSKADTMDNVKNAITGAEQFNSKTRRRYYLLLLMLSLQMLLRFKLLTVFLA